VGTAETIVFAKDEPVLSLTGNVKNLKKGVVVKVNKLEALLSQVVLAGYKED